MSFCAEQLERVRPLWQRMLDHPFLTGTRDGTLPEETFAVWMQQDYLFVEAAIPFIAALIPKAPRDHWKPHAEVLAMFETELGLFEERARAAGVDLRGVPAAFTNHAYIRYLLATAHTEPYEVGYTVLYTAEKAYHDSWRVVQAGLDRSSRWYPFVENWAGEAFAGYVAYLQGELDRLAAAAGEGLRQRMAEAFETTVRYETAFWEMAATSAGWPGGERG